MQVFQFGHRSELLAQRLRPNCNNGAGFSCYLRPCSDRSRLEFYPLYEYVRALGLRRRVHRRGQISSGDASRSTTRGIAFNKSKLCSNLFLSRVLNVGLGVGVGRVRNCTKGSKPLR
jgi:hypothetical protein